MGVPLDEQCLSCDGDGFGPDWRQSNCAVCGGSGRRTVPSIGDDFTAFWAAYPRRVGKLDALKAYERARKLDSAESILAGVAKYKRHMPDEARFVCHPATWLNKGRWMDEYEVVVEEPAKEDWFTICQQTHNGECGLNQQRHAQRVWNEAYKAREQAS